jgi:hypothetical protein
MTEPIPFESLSTDQLKTLARESGIKSWYILPRERLIRALTAKHKQQLARTKASQK